MGHKRLNHTTQHDHRANNYSKIDDICQIRQEAVTLGLHRTTRRWRHRYDVTWLEDVIFYRIHKSILAESAQYEVDGP